MSATFMRVTTAASLRLALLALLGSMSITAILRADEPPPPASGEVRLASGRVVDFTIHFDRNSLRDSLRVGDCLIALTSSGALLRFELPALRLVRERIDVEVACIGRGQREAVLAGLLDGRVCRVDSTTLELKEVVKLPAAPHWVGWCAAVANRPAGIIGMTRTTRRVERDGERWNEPCSVVHDLATGKTFSLEHLATTVLLDRAGRLWIGADNGEFGGHVSRIDLRSGIVAAIEPTPSHEPGEEAAWEGVYGLIELGDGQVWAYGGTSHMGMNHGEITRIDEAKARTLATFEPPENPQPKPEPSRPWLPITHIVEENRGLLVFSYSDVFRVEKALKDWKRAATLRIHYRWGRPDAMGSYPAVRTVHPPNREGEPYLLATIGDGYVVMDGPKATSHAIRGQFAAAYVSVIVNTSEGMLYSSGDDRQPTWKLGANGWEIVSLAPTFEPAPDGDFAEFEKSENEWYETRVLIGPGGMISTVSGTRSSTGTRITARRVDGKTKQMGRETSDLSPSYSFITPDGTLWNACFNQVRRFQNGRWESVQQVPERNAPSFHVKPANSDGPPWLLLDDFRHELWRLDHGAKRENPRLSRVEIREDGKALAIASAIPWSEGTLLLATRVGMRAYAHATGMLNRVNFPEPPQPATVVVFDGLGRLWWGNHNGLGLSEPGAITAEIFDRVPWVGRSRVYALAPDPQHADGVIAALGSRGVAFVRAHQRP